MLVADLQEQTRQHVLAAIKSRQITQRALGELVGIRQAHISNFVRGRRRLSLDGMDAILNALGLDVKSLIAISEHTTPSQNNCSTTLESVPLIRHEAAMNPAFGKDEILAELGYAKSLVRPLTWNQPKRGAVDSLYCPQGGRGTGRADVPEIREGLGPSGR